MTPQANSGMLLVFDTRLASIATVTRFGATNDRRHEHAHFVPKFSLASGALGGAFFSLARQTILRRVCTYRT